jgi:ribosomal protein S8
MIFIKDSISNLLSIITNTIKNNKNELLLRCDHSLLDIISVLYKEGYILSYKIIINNNNSWIYVVLNKKNGNFLIKKIKRISKPSQRSFCSLVTLKNLYSFSNGETNYIISTSRGIFTGKSCLAHGFSGEILLQIN